ncbi:MAG TPA: hypothetical protein VGJ84_22385, partial [Polyangiaceae bacterium]
MIRDSQPDGFAPFLRFAAVVIISGFTQGCGGHIEHDAFTIGDGAAGTSSGVGSGGSAGLGGGGMVSQPNIWDPPCMSYTDIAAGQGTGSGYFPSAVIDSTNTKLLVITRNDANSNKPALFRCNLDGTGCAYTDISAGQGSISGYGPSAVIDMINAKLLVVIYNGANSGKPALYRCNLDGTGCMFTDISTGQGPGSGACPSAVI